MPSLTQSPQVNICESSIRGLIASQGAPANFRSFGSAVSRIHASPLYAVIPVDVALTSNAAQVAGLGRIYFWTSWPRIRTDRASSHPHANVINLHLKIRFLFSYTGSARMQPKKIILFPVFRRYCATSTSTSRLVSASHFKANFIFR